MVAYAEQFARPGTEHTTFLQALDESKSFYLKAAAIANEEKHQNVGYPRLNALTVQLVRALVTGESIEVGALQIAEVRANLERWAEEKQEFWPFVQSIELGIFTAILDRRLAGELQGISERLTDLWMRMANPRDWDSVRNQARFLLRPYRALASPAEKEATITLQRLLDSYAEAQP